MDRSIVAEGNIFVHTVQSESGIIQAGGLSGVLREYKLGFPDTGIAGQRGHIEADVHTLCIAGPVAVAAGSDRVK